MLLLNQEGRLTYNWQARPQDTQELIVRNTFLNAADSSIIRIPSQPSPSKTRRGRKRVSWVVQVEVVMESRQGSRQLRQEESQKSLRNQILNSVRKILNDKGREELPTKKSLDTLHSLPSPHPLKKHKSTYLLTSLPLLPHPHPQPLQEASPLRLHTECPQMGTSPSERKLRNKENMRTDGS